MAPDDAPKNKNGLTPDFDTTAELWDRLVDDITRAGAPCLETLERLVGESCQANLSPLPGGEKPR